MIVCYMRPVILLAGAFWGLSIITIAGAVEYTGTQCTGIVDFEIVAGAQEVLDPTVAGAMSYLFEEVPWAPEDCVRSLRTRGCMLDITAKNYATDGLPYCKQSCEDQLAICESFNENVGGDPLALFGLNCTMLPDIPTCHSGGISTVEEVTPICPEPLVYPSDSSYDREAHVEIISGTACAIPCPNTLSFSNDEYDSFRIITLTTSSVAFVLSLITCISHYWSKNWSIVYLTIGTTIASFLMMIYFAVNYDYAIICTGNSGHVQRDPFCMSSALIVARLEDLRNSARYYIAALPMLSWIIPLSVHNIGYEWTAGNVTMCFYRTTTGTANYFWALLWAPMFGIMVVTFFLSLSTIYTVTIHTASMTEYDAKDRETHAVMRKFRKFWKYNSKQVAFVFVFVVVTVVTLGAWMDAQVDTDTREGNIEDYVTCLLEHATTDPNAGHSACGDPKTADYWQSQLVLCYVGAFGAFPFLVFGTGSLLKKRRQTKSSDSSRTTNAIRRLTASLKLPSFVRAASHSSLRPPEGSNSVEVEVGIAVVTDTDVTATDRKR